MHFKTKRFLEALRRVLEEHDTEIDVCEGKLFLEVGGFNDYLVVDVLSPETINKELQK